ncbi:uncharacterized protein LOC121733348 [Aricia agestis]|uniref:uncharacterized protein LOC121733348 n=1 Tax=Aricia agestis TaxID=91739 RepID=UPI001C20C0C2|nr:uncharacterized protein LOC121733348 [Aricia agestis]
MCMAIKIQAGSESLVRWLSVNGEGWGLGPTAVFASAAALYLYQELETAVGRDSLLQRTLLSTMVLGMLALMVHLWVCAMRFFQYYLDTVIKDSPAMLLEVTKASLLGDRSELVPLGSLTRFVRQQQPQIHVTLCWFIALCYADYVRKRCCQRFTLPYLEEWQAALQVQVVRGVQGAVRQVNSFVDAVNSRIRTCAPPPPACTLVDEATRSSCRSCATATSIPCANEAATTASEAATAFKRRAAAKIFDGSEATEAARLERAVTSKTNLIIENLRTYIALVEWLKCDESNVSVVPTVLWAVGAAALAHRLMAAMFKRFIFRRVPLWEILLQHMIYVWMLIYSLHFWAGLVHIIKYLVEVTYKTDGMISPEDVSGCRTAQQTLVWLSSATPLMLHVCTRHTAQPPVVMVWVTQNPLYRQELGPFEYYLSRPPPPPTTRRQRPLRRAYSDATELHIEMKKRRASKSI